MAGSPSNTPAGKKPRAPRVKRTAAETQRIVIDRTRKMIAKATASLQAAQIRASGRPGGNPQLIQAFETYDAVLVAIAKQVQDAPAK
jgi:hypothetical protein